MASLVTGVPQLEARLHAIRPTSGGFMKRLAISTVAEAKRRVPKKTGNLQRSIHIASLTAESARVVASAHYAAYVEFGVPHWYDITPNARKALRFAASPGGARLSGTPRTGAAVVFAKRVHHPPIKAQPFMMPGAQAAVAKSGLADEIVTEWNAAA